MKPGPFFFITIQRGAFLAINHLWVSPFGSTRPSFFCASAKSVGVLQLRYVTEVVVRGGFVNFLPSEAGLFSGHQFSFLVEPVDDSIRR